MSAKFEGHLVLDGSERLVVREVGTGEVAAECHLLSPSASRRAGGYRLERRFDLWQLKVLRDRMVEVDEVSMSRGHRPSSALPILWSALARYLVENGHDHVVGGIDISAADGGDLAASIHRAACEQAAGPEDYRVFPFERLPLERLRTSLPAEIPALLRSLLASGAWICGEPAWDRRAGTAQLPFLLPLVRMNGRYARQFLATAA